MLSSISCNFKGVTVLRELQLRCRVQDFLRVFDGVADEPRLGVCTVLTVKSHQRHLLALFFVLPSAANPPHGQLHPQPLPEA